MGINIIILFSCPPFSIVNSDVTYDLDFEPALLISQIRTRSLSLQLHSVSVCALSIPFQASPQYFSQLHSPIPLVPCLQLRPLTVRISKQLVLTLCAAM